VCQHEDFDRKPDRQQRLHQGGRDVERAGELVRAEMSGAAQLDVPLEVEVGSGRSWSEAH
jgi:hypothetical protein